MSDPGFTYVGSELELFAEAIDWKNYWASKIRPHIRGDVLEVGAGLGTNTPYLVDRAKTWTSLEPDPALVGQMKVDTALMGQPHLRIVQGTLSDLSADQLFDSIVYIDVLEHIEDDVREFDLASQHLRVGGSLVILAPAHQSLYSAFDKGVGHYRRYTAEEFRSRFSCMGMEISRVFYLDSVGLAVSLANRMLLRQSLPTKTQVLFWSRVLVPVSRVLDPLLWHRAGKTVVGVWQRLS